MHACFVMEGGEPDCQWCPVPSTDSVGHSNQSGLVPPRLVKKSILSVCGVQNIGVPAPPSLHVWSYQSQCQCQCQSGFVRFVTQPTKQVSIVLITIPSIYTTTIYRICSKTFTDPWYLVLDSSLFTNIAYVHCSGLCRWLNGWSCGARTRTSCSCSTRWPDQRMSRYGGWLRIGININYLSFKWVDIAKPYLDMFWYRLFTAVAHGT